MSLLATRIGCLRLIGGAESLSYLLLVVVAMPLKYVWHMPTAVRVVGSLHGGLFTLLCVALALVMIRHKWSFLKGAKYLVASLLPFGPLLFDKDLKQEDTAWRRALQDGVP